MIEVIKGNQEVLEFVRQGGLVRRAEFLKDLIKKNMPRKKFIFNQVEPERYTLECDKIPSFIFIVFSRVFSDAKIDYITPSGNFEILKTTDAQFGEINKVELYPTDSFLEFAHEFFQLKFRIYAKPEYVLLECNRLQPAFLERLAHGIRQPLYLQLGELREQIAPSDNLH